jgi:hypothetical protein
MAVLLRSYVRMWIKIVFPTGSKKDEGRHLPAFTSARFDDLAEPGGGEESGFFDIRPGYHDGEK